MLEQTWQAPVGVNYGMSEGLFTGSCGHGTHLPDDLCLFEPVDADGRPVPPGTASATAYLTNLYNRTLPLLRYQVTDEITVLPGRCPCGSPQRRIADPQGRLDDVFGYPGQLAVHPHVFRSALGGPEIVEYQVTQTPRGAAVRLVTESPVDTAALGRRLRLALTELGLERAEVTVTRVADLERTATGKLRRFVALPR